MNLRRLVRYLQGLKRHNNKPWFEAHRLEYDALREDFEDLVEQMILLIGKHDPAVRGASPRECIYRIHWDVRFSQDKSPYKSHFAATIGPGSKKGGRPGYYLHIDAAGKLLVAAGLYKPERRELEKVRRSILRRPKQLEAIANGKKFRRLFGGLSESDKLKSAPRGYPADHPQVELLKLRSFIAWNERPVTKLRPDGAAAYAAETARALHPLVAYLRAACES